MGLNRLSTTSSESMFPPLSLIHRFDESFHKLSLSESSSLWISLTLFPLFLISSSIRLCSLATLLVSNSARFWARWVLLGSKPDDDGALVGVCTRTLSSSQADAVLSKSRPSNAGLPWLNDDKDYNRISGRRKKVIITELEFNTTYHSKKRSLPLGMPLKFLTIDLRRYLE